MRNHAMTESLRTIAAALATIGLLVGIAFASPQEATPETPPATATALAAVPPTFGSAAGSVDEKLEASLAELDALRKQMADEMLPLSRQLASLEADRREVAVH